MRKTKFFRKIKKEESEKLSDKKLLAIDCGRVFISK